MRVMRWLCWWWWWGGLCPHCFAQAYSSSISVLPWPFPPTLTQPLPMAATQPALRCGAPQAAAETAAALPSSKPPDSAWPSGADVPGQVLFARLRSKFSIFLRPLGLGAAHCCLHPRRRRGGAPPPGRDMPSPVQGNDCLAHLAR